MSKSEASESNEGHKSQKMSRKRGAGDEGDKNEYGIPEVAAADNSTTLTTVSAPAATDKFMHTPEFRRHFAEFVPVDALMVLRLATKAWKVVAEEVIDEGVASGLMMVHNGKDIDNGTLSKARKEMCELATLAIFLLNITTIGNNACIGATNLVVVDIPEGVERIGQVAFFSCRSLIAVSFPRTLTSIGESAFG
ncbi:hypothetical protein TL16_g09341 [Triparma laevis f. inornata]|uniref:Uncharacterized protein n=1 Tax=Triparma laevis f. inornata TaxID=1714386 RepID=A0A9W7EML4_9STRA|nr:hypothetical protein TL16_g09341 [Triparma laevis f. inornata]